MAVSDAVVLKESISESERQARLDALFAKRDAAIAAGMEVWDIDRINEYLREQRGGRDSDE